MRVPEREFRQDRALDLGALGAGANEHRQGRGLSHQDHLAFGGGGNWPVWVAQEKGLFAKNGVAVKQTFTPNSVKINDDATCAVHYLPAAAIDASDRLHVTWYDNRYAVGALFHSAWDPMTATATASQFVSDATFAFSTDPRAPNRLGTSTGLAIVREVARLHGGETFIGDGPGGRGLTVGLRLPAGSPGDRP